MTIEEMKERYYKENAVHGHERYVSAYINALEIDNTTTGARLEIAMDALSDISDIPRSGRAGRLAKAVLRFLQCVRPVSFGPSVVMPPNKKGQQ